MIIENYVSNDFYLLRLSIALKFLIAAYSVLFYDGPMATHRAPIRYSDQTVWMRSLICEFDGRKLVHFAGHRLV